MHGSGFALCAALAGVGVLSTGCAATAPTVAARPAVASVVLRVDGMR